MFLAPGLNCSIRSRATAIAKAGIHNPHSQDVMIVWNANYYTVDIVKDLEQW